MTGTYAMGAPWLHWLGRCAQQNTSLGDWFATMTGQRGPQAQARFGPWGRFAGGGMPAPPPFGPPFGPPWAGPGRGWRGPKARRGDVRAAILAVLAEEPRNGYQIISVIAERSGGVWKPSPGSIYPTLQQLEDEGLVSADTDSGRRTFTLTEEGRRYVADHADEVAAPWEAMTEAYADDADGLKPLIGQVAAAMWQLMAVGTPEQQARARESLSELRRKLYGILAEDPANTESEPS